MKDSGATKRAFASPVMAFSPHPVRSNTTVSGADDELWVYLYNFQLQIVLKLAKLSQILRKVGYTDFLPALPTHLIAVLVFNVKQSQACYFHRRGSTNKASSSCA